MEDGDGERCHSDESGIWARGNQPLVNRFVSGSRCNAVGGNCGETSASMADGLGRVHNFRNFKRIGIQKS